MEQLLEKELRSFLAEYEPYAKKYFDQKIKSTKNYSPLISQFYTDLADFSGGGKRLRAFLVYLGSKLGSSPQGRTINSILPICLAFEIVHSFLLIHDDIIDKSDTRRGKLTIHKRYEKKLGSHYGMSQAIILGDIACFEAFGLINNSSLPEKVKTAVLKKFVEVLIETGYGQALDVENSYRRAKISDVWQVTDLKTARYSFVGPLTVGAIVSGASIVQFRAISDFGESVGKAFQLQDDYLGVFGDEKVLGKSVLSDMQEGKNTPLIFKAKEKVNGKWLMVNGEKVRLENIWGKKNANENDLEKVRVILKKSGALLWCQEENKRLVEKAKKYIDKISVDDNLRQILASVADFVVAREK